MATTDTESSEGEQAADIETERVENVDEGIRIRASFTRGTGVRNEDEYTIETERFDVGEALDDLDDALSALEEEYLQRIRDINPERSEESDGDE